MIQYELFLKEISNFLRSCTIKNVYFARKSAKAVIEKYGLPDLPDRFNPYYLRMCGLSTLDIPIPIFLIDGNGQRVSNPDSQYREIVDGEVELTKVIMIRLEDVDTAVKISTGIDQIKKYVWALSGTENKVAELETRMANFVPDDDKGGVIHIETGELKWSDLHQNCPVFSTGFDIKTRSEASTLPEPTTGDILNIISEQCSFIYTGAVWSKLTVKDMFDLAIKYYQTIDNIPTEYVFNQYVEMPPIEALVVIGDSGLTWNDMHENYTTVKAVDDTIYPTHNGLVKNVDFDSINRTLGFDETTFPQAGSRINFIRNAYLWKEYHENSDVTNNDVLTVYLKNEEPAINDILYLDAYFTEPYMVKIGGEKRTAVVSLIDGNMFIANDGSTFTYKDSDTLKQCTYEFNGLTWIEIPLRTLFDEEWMFKFKEEFGSVKELTTTTMKSPFDKESFNEKLVLDKSNQIVLDRHEYHGWDKPVYVPTYDYVNVLTKDFTLYTRFFNRMRDNHIKTALKYYIGADVYKKACEDYPGYIDYIKGVCYPVQSFTDTLPLQQVQLSNGTVVEVALKSDYDAYMNKLDSIISYISSKDNFELLKYDSTLLRENEADSLIQCLKRVLKCCKERWDVAEFGYEELYYSAVWVTIWSHLPYLLFAQRVLNLKTESVHVDHIWEFLESRGLKDYRTVMTNEQQLFLYKNIDYIRGNEGKQSTLRILSDKLLSAFNATVRTKSVLLDTTAMADNTNPSIPEKGINNINGLPESVSAEVKILSEDLDESTAVINDTQGRIEDFDDVFQREYVSGLIPKFGDTIVERQIRIAKAHDAIEVKKHTYAPTKLAEITQGDVTPDVTRLAMAFILQSLIRKISAEKEIGPNCVVNAIFSGLSSPKTFTIGECIALIFFAIRKRDWYVFKDKQGQMNTNKNDLWKTLSDENGNPISSLERTNEIALLRSFEDCPKTTNPSYESDCNHEFYIKDEYFNDLIPVRADIWLPYKGSHYEYQLDDQGNIVFDENNEPVIVYVDDTLPQSTDTIKEFIGNPVVHLRGKSILNAGSYRNLLQIVSPFEYSALDLTSWNNMCEAEASGNVPDKFDVVTGKWLAESHQFDPIVGTAQGGGSADGTLVGGIINGSSKSSADKWYLAPIPDPSETINSHELLIENLTAQADTMLNHYQMVRNNSNAFFNKAMSQLYDLITVKGKLKIDLVPGYKTYSEWFESDIELKSVFRSIEEGSDQVAIYGSIVDSLVTALFPADKVVISGSVDQTKYSAMKELFQWLGSYNIAYLNTASIQYETLFLPPVVFNTDSVTGLNPRPWLRTRHNNWLTAGSLFGKIERWTTSGFLSKLHKHYWPIIDDGWKFESKVLINDTEKFVPKTYAVFITDPDTGTLVDITFLIYGSDADAKRMHIFETINSKSNVKRTSVSKTNMFFNHQSSWKSVTIN